MDVSSHKNPYRPGVGTYPKYLAGRESTTHTFLALLRAAPELPANMRITGLRGVGKTVLLGHMATEARASGWFVSQIELQPGYNNEAALRQVLVRTLQSTREQISKSERIRTALGQIVEGIGEMTLTWKDVSLSLGPVPEADYDLAQTLFEVTILAQRKGYKGFALLMDEAQVLKDATSSRGEHPLSMLLACVSTLQRLGLSLGLVMCGLPTLTGNLLKARSYTERMFRGEEITSLDTKAAIEAFTKPLRGTTISASPELARTVVSEVAGYPYFIQLWGAELWEAALSANVSQLTPALLDVIRDEIYRRLDLDFYRPRVQTLTPAEQDVLLDTIKCPYPPIIVASLKLYSDKSPKNINVILGRLVESGVLFRLRKGQYEYTAPKFRQYLERHPQ